MTLAECSKKDCDKENTGTWSSSVDGFNIEIHFCDTHEQECGKVIDKIWALKGGEKEQNG